MPFYSIRLTMSVSGKSFNTAFSACLTSIPAGFRVLVANESTLAMALAIATTAPTTTTKDQFFVPANGTATIDSFGGEYIVPPGGTWNLYGRSPDTTVNNGTFEAIFHY